MVAASMARYFACPQQHEHGQLDTIADDIASYAPDPLARRQDFAVPASIH
jgi:hypothetical protein